jgi:hypothetical protein
MPGEVNLPTQPRLARLTEPLTTGLIVVLAILGGLFYAAASVVDTVLWWLPRSFGKQFSARGWVEEHFGDLP